MIAPTLSSIRNIALIAASAIMLTAGCTQRPDKGPVVVSVIGGPPKLVDPARGSLSGPTRVLLGATAQGLVRFDAAGQIEPALAERWIVTDGGMSYIFRLSEAQWANGRPVTSSEVARVLSRAIKRGSHDPLAPYLTAIDEIVEMTPEVVEIHLARPRPDLLKLFAQPELAVFRAQPENGSGPFRLAAADGAHVELRPAADPDRADDNEAATPKPEDDVTLIGERAARAVLRFAQRKSDLVTGGTFADWPLLAIADVPRDAVRVDPATGLFGLAIVSRDGFLADPANRAALAAAIDRNAIVAGVGAGWAATAQILPEQLDAAAPPAIPSWSRMSPAAARQAIMRYRASHSDPVALRIALPDGPGATLLWGHVAADLIAAGITPKRVPAGAQADLRLIDAVAPYDNARWYLANACSLCAPAVADRIDAARLAPTLAERSQRVSEAAQLLADDVAFIPIARPLRWSLVASRLRQWQGNPRAWHPLNHLRNEIE